MKLGSVLVSVGVRSRVCATRALSAYKREHDVFFSCAQERFFSEENESQLINYLESHMCLSVSILISSPLQTLFFPPSSTETPSAPSASEILISTLICKQSRAEMTCCGTCLSRPRRK